MEIIELAGAAIVLLVTLGVGTVAHELSHILTLRAFGVSYDIEWIPNDAEAGPLGLGVRKKLATVTPRSVAQGVSPWILRVAALAPFVLVLPPAVLFVGIVPDPSPSDDIFLTAATVAWLGCALPSPQDFSLFWHADRVIEDERRNTNSDR